MKKLTREQLRNVTGGLQDPPPGCYCFIIPDTGGEIGEPMGGMDPDCNSGADPVLYCLPGELLVCC
ncbi:MAG: hypothetical protein JWR09_1354 [Mucilaginibacter sp.]|nr:hypothetical protein [Mucilaginibacter sp.]